MLPLIRIRLKYIQRNPCLLFWSYLLIPIGIFALAIYSIIDRKKIQKYDEIQPYEFTEKKIFNENYNYENLSTYLNYSIFLVKGEDVEEVKNKLHKLTKLDIPCFEEEKNISDNTLNLIKLEKDNNKYTFFLASRANNLTKDNSNYTKYQLFHDKDLEDSQIINKFYISNTTDYISNNTYKPEYFKKKDLYFDLQILLSNLLIELTKKQSKTNSGFEMKFGYNFFPAHNDFLSEFGLTQAQVYAFLMTLQFSLIAFNFNLRMIDEKENKLNNLLERQGISKFKYNLSWLISFYSLFSFTFISFLFLILLILETYHLLFFFSFLLFSISLYSTCIFFSTIIKTVKEGTTAVKFFHFGSVALGLAIIQPSTPKISKLLFGIIPQLNLCSTIYCIFCLNNIRDISLDLLLLQASRISYIENCIIYIVDIVLYLGLSIIIQSYKDSGLSFLQYLKSCFTKVSRNIGDYHNIDNEKKKISFEIYHQELTELNQQKKEQNQCLRMINVSKYFDDLKAVDGFTGELFSNEIFCLLGHNGAGKSTLINMISGIFDPDEGDIFLNGKSLVTDKKYLYQNIGLCQQNDIYFDYLTVEEHLEYMCRIKGSQINKEEIDELINQIDLAPKKRELCKNLSGGQKRKLCIALALIGDSQIVLLDEPTSGMDVMARRALWEFLKNYKKDKIILLTTHFLDEAEYLGDRIGIMSDGHFLCSGTSSFLKSKYPCGFNINLLINPTTFNEDFKQNFFNGIKEYEPNAEIKVASKGIFSINIQSNNKNIPQIFHFIENNKGENIIEDYTVSSTSLEDVFLKINNKANLNDLEYSSKEKKNDQPFQYEIPVSARFSQQLKAQLIRCLYPLLRNKFLFFLELLSGLGFVYIFLFLFSDKFSSILVKRLDLFEILRENDIYLYEKNAKDFIKNSYAFQSSKGLSFKRIEEESNDIKQFSDNASKRALAKIAKSALYIEKISNKYVFYNTEVDTGLNGYFYANTMLFFSAFLKEEYDIDAMILPELSFESLSGFNFSRLISFFMDSFMYIIICIIILFGFVIFLGGLMFEKIREKRTNIKHLLYLSGNNVLGYWMAFFIVDYIKLTIFSILLILPIYYITGAATYFGLNMLLINLSSLSFIYFITFFCSKDDEGAKILFLILIAFLMGVGLLSFIVGGKAFSYVSSFSRPYYPNLFDFTPLSSMALAFIRIMFIYLINEKKDDADQYVQAVIEGMNLSSPFEYVITCYIAQLINFIFYSTLLMLAEKGLIEKIIHSLTLSMFGNRQNYVFGKLQASEDFTGNNISSPLLINQYEQNVQLQINNNNNEIITNPVQQPQPEIPSSLITNNISNISDPLQNPYVQKEKSKVEGGQNLTTRIEGLTKTFYVCCKCGSKRQNVRAINNLYLGLGPNEKFGLLGFNGSGKTTTFRAITNEILTDSGSITLFGYDTKRQFEHIRTMIGYCPQINPLFDFMKVKEIIKFYSNLKICYDSVESICEKFGLSKYLNTYTINLSGGNKRKLTFAIAMMNRPSLLLLDEPSTGVDPESRRIMWRNINELSNSGHQYNMILTTHSMEEAEVLCDTVSWFKDGNFITVGNPEELKIQYSAGYKLHIKFDPLEINKNQNPNNIGIDFITDAFNKISTMVCGMERYSNYIMSNPAIEPYLSNLIKIVLKIKDKTQKITLMFIGKDLSFELVISIIKERQKELFSEILNMKNVDNTIAEMSISMQSLENILTSLN